MQRTLFIVAAFSRFTLDNTQIAADEWLRMYSSAPEGYNGYCFRMRLRTHKDFVTLGTVTASSRAKVKQAAEAFVTSDAYKRALDEYGIGVTTFPVINWFDPERLAAEIQEEQERHAELDRKLQAEQARRDQWYKPVNLHT